MSIEPFRRTSHDLLDQLEPVSGSPFVCPGSVAAVSRSIHLARLNAAWPGCDHCEWRFDTEGLATRTVQETARIRGQRVDGIRRTEFGIRGAYINDLDRQTSAELARIFCACLHEQSLQDDVTAAATGMSGAAPQRRDSSQESAQSAPAFQVIPPVIIGYDGGSGSLDLAVGVVAASREFGMPVIDIGHCTAASIQEAARCFHECCGAILVTGAGAPKAWAGLDVFDRRGDAVPVVWKDFGVQLEHVSTEATSFLRLRLPPPSLRSRRKLRLTRQSGLHDVVAFEDRYRNWLLQWYPKQAGLRTLVRTDDVLQQQRLAWLAQTSNPEIICRSTRDAAATPHVALTMTIAEDDRNFQVLNSSGQPVSSERLALALNHAMNSHTSHLTAHADSASDRFWLADAARIGGRKSTESVRDALATLGLITRLAESKRLATDF